MRARHQSGGRGRFDRAWVTPRASCLTLSLILEPSRLEALPVTQVTQFAALAVADTIEDQGPAPRLKWPNDVLVSDAKIAGILAEQDARFLVLGIGLNVNLAQEDLAAMDLGRSVTSLRIVLGTELDIDALCSTLLGHVRTRLDAGIGHGPASLLEDWRQRDALAGTRVALRTAQGDLEGRYDGIDAQGQLCLLRDSGERTVHSAGDVSRVTS